MAGEINFGILNTNAPMQAATAFQEGQDRRRKNRIEELAAQQAEQQFSDDQAYREAYHQTGGDTNALLKTLSGKGLYKQANELQKQQLEAEAKRATIGKDASTAGKNKVEAEAGQYKLTAEKHDRAIRDISSFQSPQDALSSVDRYVAIGEITPEFSQQMKASIPVDPAQFSAWKQKTLAGLMSAKDQLEFAKPQPKEVQLGNRVAFVDMNPNSPTYKRELSSQSVGINPGTAAQLAQGERHFRANQSNQSKAPSGYRFLPGGNMEAIPGGPADVKEQAKQAQKAAGATDVDSAVATLRDAYDRLEKGGGITSTKNGISNLAASASSSGVGQAVGRALGTSNQSARNDIAMTRPALLAALMKATGMSAKQMDSNAELKLWMATATDPTLDVEANRRALDAIERKYISGAERKQPPANPGEAVKINSDAEFNALPSGATFIGPDGKTRRKP